MDSGRSTAADARGRASGLARGTCLLALTTALLLCLAGTAFGAERVYWTNGLPGNTISYANLDGSGGGDLDTGGATVDWPIGLALDPAANRVYWVNYSSETIAFANLDGGGGELNIGGATMEEPEGVAVDPAAGRIYWANHGANKISYANLDGGGGGDVATGGATVAEPVGVAVDPSSGRIYWANVGSNNNKISYANLDGGGGGDVATGGATVSEPLGVAVDPTAHRVYWDNFGADKISYANLDGGGGADLDTGGATVSAPEGIAVDPAAGRVYWANLRTDTISYANLDGGGGGDLDTGGATLSHPTFPSLLSTPTPAGPPTIAGGSAVGSTLSCSAAAWAPDLPGAFFYQAPHTVAYSWSRDGTPIDGADGSSLSASDPGQYRCAVSATNAAGSTSQESGALTVSAPATVTPPPASTPMRPPASLPVVAPTAFGRHTLVTVAPIGRRIPAAGPLRVRITNRNAFPVVVRLTGRTTRKVAVPKPRLIKLATRSLTVPGHNAKTVGLALPRPLRRLPAGTRALDLRLSLKVTAPAGHSRTLIRRVRPRLEG